MLVQLTDRRGEKFYLNTELVEVILEREGNTSEIRLTTGRFVTCIESPDSVSKIISISEAKND
jgi:hypothetical protein